ncbi:DUF4232 domain-containing protein [Cryptosporangium phraense]|uniref:DUF4232 domain-containing protein n=1 Tax=Cryptosporangium phraense TaxID=2593070 RepID=A0A545AZJ4_9ACTN|nr:DUF4232 domain-containing protein [Cryptosporangium phraense]TQS46746.1 DUF4232 domain-containing protein [Cryptosporangium phraense]
MQRSLVGACLSVVLLAGCSSGSGPQTPTVGTPAGPGTPYASQDDQSDEVGSNQPVEPLSVAPPEPGTKPPLQPATQAPPPPPGDTAPCKTAQLSARVIRQLGTGKTGPGVGLVILTNLGSRECALSGWPVVGLTSKGTALSVPATKVNRPHKPVGMLLKPRRTAFAGIQWRGCPPTATGCRTGDGFRVGAPGSTSIPAELAGFSSAEKKGFPVSAIVVGSLQPTTTDILNW